MQICCLLANLSCRLRNSARTNLINMSNLPKSIRDIKRVLWMVDLMTIMSACSNPYGAYCHKTVVRKCLRDILHKVESSQRVSLDDHDTHMQMLRVARKLHAQILITTFAVLFATFSMCIVGVPLWFLSNFTDDFCYSYKNKTNFSVTVAYLYTTCIFFVGVNILNVILHAILSCLFSELMSLFILRERDARADIVQTLQRAERTALTANMVSAAALARMRATIAREAPRPSTPAAVIGVPVLPGTEVYHS